MNTLDTIVALWVLVLLAIVCFNALAIRQLIKMREEE
jgi:hypothetical protein